MWERCSIAFTGLLSILFCGAAGAQEPVVLGRVPADGAWDVVAQIAGFSSAPAGSDGRFAWGLRQRLELLFANRAAPRQSVRIVSDPGPNDDCNARIERMTATVMVVSCVGEKWAVYENREYFYDPQARQLIRRTAYMPFTAVRIGRAGIIMGRPTAVPAGRKEFLRVEIDSQGQPRAAGPAAAPAEDDAEAAFGPFQIARRKNRYGSDYLVIGEGNKIYELPQSDEATWRAARPDDVKAHLHMDPDERNEEIGPHQWVGGNLWFGKSFYNSEGLTGVGGFGYFDTAGRRFQLYAPAEIWRWSVSGILVEADAVWLALCRRGEYNNYPGGLLRWDRQSGNVRRIALDRIGWGMVRISGFLCIGSGEGLVILHGDEPAGYLVDRSLDGRWEMAGRDR
jgi:hypothetical protein